MVNPAVWLEDNYPTNGTCTRVEDTVNCSPGNAKNRSEIYNLDVSNQKLEGSLCEPWQDFPNLKKVNISHNEITCGLPGSAGVWEEIDYSHNSHGGSWWDGGSILSLKKLNLSHNYIEEIKFSSISSIPQLNHLDVSSNSLRELNLEVGNNLAYLDTNNNKLTKLVLKSPQITYLDVSNNFLKELDLSIITNLQTLNCSHNPNLASSTLTLPNNFKPSVLDCYNTSLKNLTFSNSSIFDCEKGRLISETTPATTTSTSTPQTTNDLALNLSLGLGIPLAVILIGLTAFFGYKWKKSRQAVPTAGSS